ncbi:putative anthocyanidin synthase [Helianthus debilis subsp. tardiflorus]
MESVGEWPEPVLCVQSLSESGNLVIPNQYIKPPSERPSVCLTDTNIPVIDMTSLISSRQEAMKQVFEACREWGFMQLVNHGVKTELLDGAREIWREFFHAPMEVKKKYANSPKTYEGFGSRQGRP